MFIADRMKAVGSAIFSEMAELKQLELDKGKQVVDLSIGTPDLPPPVHVIEAMREALLQPDSFHYSLKGSQQLHQVIADWYQERFAVSLNTDTEILTLMGSQDGLAHLPMAILNLGDLALIPDPGYPIYFSSVELAGGTIYKMPLIEENGFLPDLQNIPEQVARKAKIMILNYPSNPVSAIADMSFFEQVIAFAHKYEILVVHDLAYSELCFDGYKPPSLLEVDRAKDVAVEINSLSKSYNMAGARIGFMVGNASIIRTLAMLKGNIDYGVFKVVQAGAIAALTGGTNYCAEMSKVYERRRDVLIKGFSELGWNIEPPKATMFVWAKIPQGFTSRDFAVALLQKAGISVIPGDAFGEMGEGYVRIGLVQDEQAIKQAIQQLKVSDLRNCF